MQEYWSLTSVLLLRRCEKAGSGMTSSWVPAAQRCPPHAPLAHADPGRGPPEPAFPNCLSRRTLCQRPVFLRYKFLNGDGGGCPQLQRSKEASFSCPVRPFPVRGLRTPPRHTHIRKGRVPDLGMGRGELAGVAIRRLIQLYGACSLGQRSRKDCADMFPCALCPCTMACC